MDISLGPGGWGLRGGKNVQCDDLQTATVFPEVETNICRSLNPNYRCPQKHFFF